MWWNSSRVPVRPAKAHALWDESEKLYPLLGAEPNQGGLYWTFLSGATVSFKHLEHEKTVPNWQRSQILICFDELTHFIQKQFWYMVGRNRSMCGGDTFRGKCCTSFVSLGASVAADDTFPASTVFAPHLNSQ